MKKTLIHLILLPWTLWCFVAFCMVAFCMFPFLIILISSGKQSWLKKAHHLPDFCSWLVLKLWCIQVEVHGKENIDSKAQFVFCGNHRSYLDPLILASVNDNTKKYIGKAEILKWPVLGYLLQKLYIPVHRDDKAHRRWSLEETFRKASEGASIVFFPEGTCNATTDLFKHFHDGAFKLAIGCQIPLVPFTIIGAGEHWHRNNIYIIPGKIKIYFHKPIATTTFTQNEEDVAVLKSLAQEEMKKILQPIYPNGYSHV